VIDNSTTKPEECESCNFKTAALVAYRQNRYLGSRQDTSEKETHKWLCLLCASTMAGTAAEYPEQYGDHAGDILQAICFVGNMILSSLDNKNGGTK
jgi:hypothetical protein